MDKDEIYAPFLPQGDTLDPDLQKGLLGYDETDQQLRPQMPFQQHRASPPLHPPIIGYPPTFPFQSAIQLPLVQQNYQAQSFITVPPVQFALHTYGFHPQQVSVNLQSRLSSFRPPSTEPTNLSAVPSPFEPFITVPSVPLPLRTYGLHPIPQQQAPVNLQLPQSSVRPPSTVPANLPAVPATPGPPNRLMIPLRTGRNTLSFKTLPFENEKKEFYLNVS